MDYKFSIKGKQTIKELFLKTNNINKITCLNLAIWCITLLLAIK